MTENQFLAAWKERVLEDGDALEARFTEESGHGTLLVAMDTVETDSDDEPEFDSGSVVIEGACVKVDDIVELTLY